MSSNKTSNSEKNSFIERFTEVCNSSQPNDIARLLNISYQAAKNYLSGRKPDTQTLKRISEQTDYSINWLLTGEGEKLVKNLQDKDTLLLTDQMRAFVRQTCMEVIGEVLNNQVAENQPKTIVLNPEKIKAETISEPTIILSENKD